MIDQIFINICSIMAASDSWNIAFYCGRIFTQSFPNSEIIQNCVVIVFLLTYEEWDFRNYGPDMAIHRIKPVVHWWNIAPTDCPIGATWSNFWLIWKRYHALSEKGRILYFNLFQKKFIAYYIKMTQIDTLHRNLIKMKLSFNMVDFKNVII